MRLLPLLALVAGCGFQVSGAGATSDDLPSDDQPPQDGDIDTGSGSDGDAGADAMTELDIAHVAAGDEESLTSELDWTITQNQVLDTGSMQANPPLPPGVVMKVVTQENGGPDLMILQAHSIELGSVTFRVVGTRALVLVATTEITIAGTLDASADHQNPGAAGGGPETGAGAGAHAVTDGIGNETGGNGASFGTVGGEGGDYPTRSLFAANAAAAYGSAGLAQLAGGSGGGTATPNQCNTRGGGGGGAVQLTARTITVNGSVRANGGGGLGGSVCDTGNTTDASSGGGGGSGGAIYIQADAVAGTGWLVANGGAGGGGGCVTCSAGSRSGEPGENGSATAVAAMGGSSALPPSGTGFGGAGGTSASLAVKGADGGNAGGGGGAVGRIHLAVMPSGLGTINASPPAQ